MYFNKTATLAAKEGDPTVTYAVFMRTPIIVAVDLAEEWLRRVYDGDDLIVNRLHEDGTELPAGRKIMEITGKFSQLAPMETILLQKIGWSCVSAYNAYKQCMALKRSAFMDMHARHATGIDMNICCSYGASIGSKTAKRLGAIGFIGSSQTITAPFFGQKAGMGTMPHALIGLYSTKYPDANATVKALMAYTEQFPDESVYTVLVDYFGREITDGIESAKWFNEEFKFNSNKILAVRLDTHGGRWLEGLDWATSVETLKKWTHLGSPDEIFDQAVATITPRELMGQDVEKIKDKYLFGTGVTAAAIVRMRKALDDAGFNSVKIVASSGFNVMKCQIMANLNIPVDMVGTGSFLPEKTSSTFATADIIRYDDIASVKVGREYLLGN